MNILKEKKKNRIKKRVRERRRDGETAGDNMDLVEMSGRKFALLA